MCAVLRFGVTLNAVVEVQIDTAQQRFDEKYITSAEICKVLDVGRTSVLQAKKRGLLPDPVYVGDVVCIWERAAVTPYLKAWRTVLGARRATAPQGALASP